MNLMQNHAAVFRRNQYVAWILYGCVSMGIAGGGFITIQDLNKQNLLLQKQIQQLKKEDVQTMEDVQYHLSHLFSVPLSGISFSTLSLDEKGMLVRGNAKTIVALEKWIGEISKIFSVEKQAEKQISQKGMAFEVLLHEKR